MKQSKSFLVATLFFAVLLTAVGCGGSGDSGLYQGSYLPATVLGEESEITSQTVEVFEDEIYNMFLGQQWLPQLGAMFLELTDFDPKAIEPMVISTVISDGEGGTMSAEGTINETGTSIVVYNFENFNAGEFGIIDGGATFRMVVTYPEEGGSEPESITYQTTYSNLKLTGTDLFRAGESITVHGTSYISFSELTDTGVYHTNVSYISDKYPENSFKIEQTWTVGESEGDIVVEGKLYNQLRGGYLTVSITPGSLNEGDGEFILTGFQGGVVVVIPGETFIVKIDVDGDGTFEFDNTPI